MGPVAAATIAAGVNAVGNYFGAREYSKAQKHANELNAALAREFAQNGIRWRVEDAKAAGIHPVYALGSSYSPSAPVMVGDSGQSSTFQNMGQDISRAVMATQTINERADAFSALQVENMELQNELLRSRITQLQQPTTPPPFPSAHGIAPNLVGGQGDALPGMSGMVVEQPSKPVATSPYASGREVGSIPSFAFERTATGLSLVPSKDVKERIEDDLIGELMWHVRNRIQPMERVKPDPREFPLPRGQEWKWYFPKQEFRPAWFDGSWVK